MSGEGVDQEGEGVALLNLEAGDHGHDAFDKESTADAVGTDTELEPDVQPAEQALGKTAGGGRSGSSRKRHMRPDGAAATMEGVATMRAPRSHEVEDVHSLLDRDQLPAMTLVPDFYAPLQVRFRDIGGRFTAGPSLLGGRDEFCEFCCSVRNGGKVP